MSKFKMLEKLLEEHQTDGFWVSGSIPKRKIDNAIAHFPLDPLVKVYGLIDCTVLGSCKNGLAITEQGLTWKNSWVSETTKTKLSWDELAQTKEKIKVEKYALVLGNNAELYMAGSRLSIADAFKIFHAMIDLFSNSTEELISTETTTQKKPVVKEKETLQQTSFDTSLISALALMVAADGKIDTDEIDLVIAFINEEESIIDKEEALSDFEEHINKLVKSHNNSKAIFKLQSEKLIAGIEKFTDMEIISKFEIMLEGMVEAAGGLSNEATVEMMKRIMNKQKLQEVTSVHAPEEEIAYKLDTVEEIKVESVNNTQENKLTEFEQLMLILEAQVHDIDKFTQELFKYLSDNNIRYLKTFSNAEIRDFNNEINPIKNNALVAMKEAYEIKDIIINNNYINEAEAFSLEKALNEKRDILNKLFLNHTNFTKKYFDKSTGVAAAAIGLGVLFLGG